MAYVALQDKVPPRLAVQWEHLLSDYDPKETYDRTFTNKPFGLQNFCAFAVAGEASSKSWAW